MAQNVTIAGAQYPSVPAVDIPKTGGGTARFVDTSDANADASDILQGKIAYVNGQKITGSISNGSVTVNTPTINAFGVITASASVRAGYVNVTPASKTLSLTTQGSTTITPTKQQQTAVASGIYTTGPVYVDAIPSEYIIPTGSKDITANADNIDVTQYSTVNVNVSGGGGEECDLYAGKEAPTAAVNGDLWLDTSDEPTGKAVQISNASNRRSGTSYDTISNVTLTVEKAGTYDIYWTGFRSATSGTFGTQLYKNNSSQGSQQTTFSNHEQHPKLTNVTLAVGDVLTIKGRSGSTSNYIYASNLIIIEAGD